MMVSSVGELTKSSETAHLFPESSTVCMVVSFIYFLCFRCQLFLGEVENVLPELEINNKTSLVSYRHPKYRLYIFLAQNKLWLFERRDRRILFYFMLSVSYLWLTVTIYLKVGVDSLLLLFIKKKHIKWNLTKVDQKFHQILLLLWINHPG